MARAPAELKNEIATIANDPNRWLFGDRISPEDSTLESRGRGKGLALYDDLARDGQVGAVLAKRRAALIARPWEVEPADDTAAARRAAELVTAQLKALGIEGLIEELLGALLKGVGIVEVLWDATADGIAPVAAKGRDPRRFAFAAATDAAGRAAHQLRLLTRARPLDGEPVPERKFVVHRFGRRYDNPWGLGLGHQLFWPVFFKRKGVGFWLGALEKFGQPTALGRYPPGTPEKEQDKLLAALQAIASDAGVTVPEGMTVELLEAKRGGTFDSYRDLAQYMDAEISKIVLGETLTTAVGESGSRALGDVHNEVRLELTRADADQLSRTLNGTLVRWIVELNLPSAPPPRLWWDVSEPEDLAALAARDEALVRIGYRPTLDRITDVYGEGYAPIGVTGEAHPERPDRPQESRFSDNWKSQPRVPAGSERGGQWTSEDGGAWSTLVESALGLKRRSRIEAHAIHAGVPRDRIDAFVDAVRARQDAAQRDMREAAERFRAEAEAFANSPEGRDRAAAVAAALAARREAQAAEDAEFARRAEQARAEYRSVPIVEDWSAPHRARYHALVDSYSARPEVRHFAADKIEQEARLATVDATARALNRAGWSQSHRSRDDAGRASSAYLVSPDRGFEVRISDHHLPETPDRQFRRESGGPRWQLDIVVDDWRDRRVADYVNEIEMARARARGDGVLAAFREAPARPRDAADDLTDQLGAVLAEGEDPLIAALTALVERAASLEEVRDGLVALLPEISDARLAELMAQALIVANLQGRADLADGV